MKKIIVGTLMLMGVIIQSMAGARETGPSVAELATLIRMLEMSRSTAVAYQLDSTAGAIESIERTIANDIINKVRSDVQKEFEASKKFKR